ncbi:hypothetical protein [Novosphingobium sp.]|uniref:hypothetical protein n=1 Tax=Novosphingobium sp. TaxID=1874826 RepID=UPI003D0DE9CF
MSRDPALARFALLQAVRLFAALVALTGAVILSHGQPALAHVPDVAGGALLVIGAAGFFLIPYALAKLWKRQA